MPRNTAGREDDEKTEVEHSASADDAARYSTGQDRWQAFVARNIEVTSRAISEGTFRHFHEVFAHLAEERARIADELGQQDPDESENQFGRFPHEQRHCMELIIRKGNTWSAWANQAPSITEQIERILISISAGEEPTGIVHIKDSDNPSECQKIDDTFGTSVTKHIWTFSFKSPELNRSSIDDEKISSVVEHIEQKHGEAPSQTPRVDTVNQSQKLATFTVAINGDGKINSLFVEYPGYNKYNLVGDYLIANKLFTDLNNWSPTDGLEEFKRRVGKLAHYSAHRLLIERGTAGITEIMLKAVADSKGIDLAEVGLRTDIGWAWKALVTPTADEYAEWFKDNVFQNMKMKPELTASADSYEALRERSRIMEKGAGEDTPEDASEPGHKCP